MTDFFAEYLTEILIINGIIYADKRDFYMYGLDLFFIKLSFYVTILVLSIITNTLPISILYVLLFTMLRKYTGGYHSKTFTLCFLTSILIYLVMILIYRIAVETVVAPMTICAVISFIIVILFAPVESINKPLSVDEQKKYRKISLILVSIYCLASVITLNLNYYWVSFVLSWSLTADAVLIILGKFMKGEVHNEEGSVKSNC